MSEASEPGFLFHLSFFNCNGSRFQLLPYPFQFLILCSCEQEIILLSQLSHPNIVQYYGSELVRASSLYVHQYSSLYMNSIHPVNNHECPVLMQNNSCFPFLRVLKSCQFIWNMSLEVPSTNYFKNMGHLGSLLSKITLGRFSPGLLTYMEGRLSIGNWLLLLMDNFLSIYCYLKNLFKYFIDQGYQRGKHFGRL